jgi:hypothetical protein
MKNKEKGSRKRKCISGRNMDRTEVLREIGAAGEKETNK